MLTLNGPDKPQGRVCFATIACLWLFFLPVFQNTAAGGWGNDAVMGTTGGDDVPDVLSFACASGAPVRPGESAIIVDKSNQQISFYSHDEKWRRLYAWPCSTGKRKGRKQKEGDSKTPEGIYFVTRTVGEAYLTDTYGSRAMPLNYPNLVDKRDGRTGSAIWIHGTNKPLKPRDSNGCVVMQNDHIDHLASLIKVNHTPVIIVDSLGWRASDEMQSEARLVLDMGRRWHQRLTGAKYDTFKQLYLNDAAPNEHWWNHWEGIRTHHGIDNLEMKSFMTGCAAYGFNDKMVFLFDHHLALGRETVYVGRKKLIMQLRETDMSIIGDAYQTTFGNDRKAARTDPLFAAWEHLWRNIEARREFSVKAGEGRGPL